MKEILEIKNKSEQIVQIDKVHETEIKEYLAALDLIKDIRIADIENFGNMSCELHLYRLVFDILKQNL